MAEIIELRRKPQPVPTARAASGFTVLLHGEGCCSSGYFLHRDGAISCRVCGELLAMRWFLP